MYSQCVTPSEFSNRLRVEFNPVMSQGGREFLMLILHQTSVTFS